VNNGPLLFLGILASVATSFWTLLFAPQWQIGRQQAAVIELTGERYPAGRSGGALQGAEVYRSLGCVECHSQQVRQTGVNFELWLADPGTNRPALVETLVRLNLAPAAEATKLLDDAPVKLRGSLSSFEARALASQLTNDDAKAEAVLAILGPDIQRGWGKRLSVTQDYLHDYPVQIGSLRVGPDLANYGSRQPGAGLILVHLYAPQKTMPRSMMPPYRFLFTKRKLNAGEKPALPLEVEPGYDVIPGPEAEALAAYLASLKSEMPLPEAPVPAPPTKPAPGATNAPAAP
jgi:hypothetical protein